MKVGMGSDSACTYVTHYNAWRELDYLVRFGGMTPAQALHAATQANAEILGWGEITGRIEPGFDADLAVVDGNPLESFRNLAQPSVVIARTRHRGTPRSSASTISMPSRPTQGTGYGWSA